MLNIILCVCLFVFFSHVQEAKMLIAKAYRHTEKLLLDNRDKLILVRSKIVKIFLRKKLRNVKINSKTFINMFLIVLLEESLKLF